LQQKPTRQVLQPLEWVRYLWPERNIAQKELFRFFDLPDPQPRAFVNLMLKKNRHVGDFRF
jgi:hypothetical protein